MPPDIEDAGGHGGRRRGPQEGFQRPEKIAADVRDPHGAVTERLDLGRRVDDLARVVVAQRSRPDASNRERFYAPYVYS